MQGIGVYAALVGVPGNASVAVPGLTSRTAGAMLAVGLLSGLLTFGGAYVLIPFIAGLHAAWLANQVLLDAIAITLCLPAPLVSFVAFVGYDACGLGCALIIMLGVCAVVWCVVCLSAAGVCAGVLVHHHWIPAVRAHAWLPQGAAVL